MYETGRIPREGVFGLWDRALNIFERIPMDIVLFACRVGIGGIFLKSAYTKVVEPWSFTLGDQTAVLFEYEYQLPVLPPDVAALGYRFGVSPPPTKPPAPSLSSHGQAAPGS